MIENAIDQTRLACVGHIEKPRQIEMTLDQQYTVTGNCCLLTILICYNK